MNAKEKKRLDYDAFLGKFQPKRTTDDCLTPPNVWEAVRGWVFDRYGLDPGTPVVRPFWPGGDYERHDYPKGCVVLDNPPFSIVSKIVNFYAGRGIGFFLFAPYMTNFTIGRGLGCCHVIAPWTVRYENGAAVPTSFVTNLDADLVAEAAPDLRALVREADEKNRKAGKAELPVYAYPPDVITSAGLGYLASHGTPFRVARGECAFIRGLDQGPTSIFGSGLLLSERAAAEHAAAERIALEHAAAEHVACERAAAERAAARRAAARKFSLSDRERRIQATLGSAPRE